MGLVIGWFSGSLLWIVFLRLSVCDECGLNWWFIILTALFWPVCLLRALWELYQESRR